MIQKTEWSPWRTVPAAKPSKEMLDLMKGTPWEGARALKPKKQSQRMGRTLVAKIVPADARTAKSMYKVFDKLVEGFDYISPRLPSPGVWEQLKRAGSLAEMRRALRFLEKYLKMNWSGWFGRECPHRLDRHVDALLAAKRLFNYPRSKRTRSDDKRIVFFARVLAGLELGRSPLYAIKRLSYWRPLKDLTTKPLQEFVASLPRRGDPE